MWQSSSPRAGSTRNNGAPLDDLPSRITEILDSLDLGDPEQADQLLTLLYDELRALAAVHLRAEQDGHTLQPTALVHEAYLRLAGGSTLSISGRRHFFRIASRAMRRVLVDAARSRGAEKRGGGVRAETLDSQVAGPDGQGWDVIDVHEALERLAELDPDLERLVEMRFFTGLTLAEAADNLGVSERKAYKDWAVARLWLRRELGDG